jgi:hypothetical protein
MATSANPATTEEVLGRFLAEQRERLSDKTLRRYEAVQVLRHSLDGGCAYGSLDDSERRRWEVEFEANEERAFCRLFA